MAELGYEVLGLDVDKAKIDKLAAGEVPFFEPGLDELLRKNLATGRLQFTTSFEQAGEFGDVHFVCVGTPQKKGEYAADLTYVNAAFDSLTAQVRSGSVIVRNAPVPAGTAAMPLPRVTAAGATLVWNPEFLREGFAVEDTLRPDRIVLGINSELGEKVLRECYHGILETGVPVVVTDFATAELVKVAANSFLATKISFINAMAEVCEATHADVTKLTEALSP